MSDFKRIKKDKPLKDFEVVFDANGNLNHQNYKYQNSKVENNHVFSDHLEYAGYFSSTGGNSHIKLKSLKTSRMYHMFMSDFDDVLDEKRFIDNQIVGLFCFCRKGNSQGIRLLFENP